MFPNGPVPHHSEGEGWLMRFRELRILKIPSELRKEQDSQEPLQGFKSIKQLLRIVSPMKLFKTYASTHMLSAVSHARVGFWVMCLPFITATQSPHIAIKEVL